MGRAPVQPLREGGGERVVCQSGGRRGRKEREGGREGGGREGGREGGRRGREEEGREGGGYTPIALLFSRNTP